jgi:DNA-binding XRE family transcriptional regulator
MDASYRFVYQEWDMMRERVVPQEERVERTTASVSNKVNFGMQLQQARIRNRITIHDLAAKCGLAVHHLTAYETGAEVPSSELMIKIRETLGIK